MEQIPTAISGWRLDGGEIGTPSYDLQAGNVKKGFPLKDDTMALTLCLHVACGPLSCCSGLQSITNEKVDKTVFFAYL